MTDPNFESEAHDPSPDDERLYALYPDSCTVSVKRTAEKEYCYAKLPGEEYFHLLMPGEIYVETHGERFCLNCAFRRGDLTRNRLHWKRPD